MTDARKARRQAKLEAEARMVLLNAIVNAASNQTPETHGEVVTLKHWKYVTIFGINDGQLFAKATRADHRLLFANLPNMTIPNLYYWLKRGSDRCHVRSFSLADPDVVEKLRAVIESWA